MVEDQGQLPAENTRTRVKARAVVSVSVALTITLEIGIGTSVSGEGRTLLMISQAIAIFSAFMVGNAYRLKDHRRRMGRLARCTDGDSGSLAGLPSKETVRRRTQIAVAGAGFGEATTVFAALSLDSQPREAQSVVMVGIAVTLLCGFIGTYSAPLD